MFPLKTCVFIVMEMCIVWKTNCTCVLNFAKLTGIWPKQCILTGLILRTLMVLTLGADVCIPCFSSTPSRLCTAGGGTFFLLELLNIATILYQKLLVTNRELLCSYLFSVIRAPAHILVLNLACIYRVFINKNNIERRDHMRWRANRRALQKILFWGYELTTGVPGDSPWLILQLCRRETGPNALES